MARTHGDHQYHPPSECRIDRVAQSLGAVGGEMVEFFGAPSVLYHYPAA
jgi:hypothetical protein